MPIGDHMKRSCFIISFVILVLVGCSDANRGGTSSVPTATDSTGVEPDNSQVNVRDRTDAVKTPINQNENQKDINITADIRQRVVDTQMSVNAQNIKIITQDGKVTLRGPVATAEEKNRLESIAGEVAGPSNVLSQLEIQ